MLIFSLVFLMGFSTLAYARANPCICGGNYSGQYILGIIEKNTGVTAQCERCLGAKDQYRKYKRTKFVCGYCGDSYITDIGTSTYIWHCDTCNYQFYIGNHIWACENAELRFSQALLFVMIFSWVEHIPIYRRVYNQVNNKFLLTIRD